ncbi:MAG: RNA polymerase sigma factor [Bacteroidia bacterium]
MSNSSENKIVDHLFRHQYGKMVAILIRLFGASKIELVEDAIQDTFLKAALKWRNELPKNPEAWLTLAAKNRVIDLLRQLNATQERHDQIIHGSVALEINEYFLDHEVADSQLRMIFLACNPTFSQAEQIAFALKSISGFSLKEIAAALLQKEETIKKRLTRARLKIKEKAIQLEYPSANEIPARISAVLQIIYLIFNEGFHSTKPDILISKDLCGEALRLCKLLLVKERFRTGSLYALFALLCFHSARLESKISDGAIVDLKHQDRSKWYMPLIKLGFDALAKSTEFADNSIYHLEAAIAVEHIQANKFEDTNWAQILTLYDEMYQLIPSDNILLSQASILLQKEEAFLAKEKLEQINVSHLQQRQYLYHGVWAEYYDKTGNHGKALEEIELAIESCSNQLETHFLEQKRQAWISQHLDDIAS